MPDELCAREGCGESKILHSSNFTLADMATAGYSDTRVVVGRPEGTCVANGCDCPAYLAPTPPEPERKPYVVELLGPVTSAVFGHAPVIPLDEYLAAHTLARCLCGHIKGTHVRAKCIGNWKWITKTGIPVSRPCHCKKFEAQP